VIIFEVESSFLVPGVQTGDELAGTDAVADLHRALDQLAVDAEGLAELGLGLHGAGQHDAAAVGATGDRERAQQANLGRRRRRLALAYGEQRRRDPSERRADDGPEVAVARPGRTPR
jgi:hypothetical protein